MTCRFANFDLRLYIINRLYISRSCLSFPRILARSIFTNSWRIMVLFFETFYIISNLLILVFVFDLLCSRGTKWLMFGEDFLGYNFANFLTTQVTSILTSLKLIGSSPVRLYKRVLVTLDLFDCSEFQVALLSICSLRIFNNSCLICRHFETGGSDIFQYDQTRE